MTLPAIAGCGGAEAEEKPGGRATVAIEGTTYDVVGVSHDSWAVVTALHLEAR